MAEEAPWEFTEIAACDPDRAALLGSAPCSESVAASVLARFESELRAGQIRIGTDESVATRDELRVTLQFHVGEKLSDWFFNATTGYRAQFRLGWNRGLEFNHRLISQMREVIVAAGPGVFRARRLSHDFEDLGPTEVTREQVCAALDPDLSKIWICAKLIATDGQIVQLPSGVAGPRLNLVDRTSWAAIARDEHDVWLDVKGAFLGPRGPYQLKDPVARAKRLEVSGEA